jgi:hypothetical protein
MRRGVLSMVCGASRYDEKIALEAKYSRGEGAKLHVRVRGGVRYSDSTSQLSGSNNNNDAVAAEK